MGQSAYSMLCKKKEIRILINGLDAAGKTTVLYRMKMGETVNTIPTIGFNVETVSYKNLHLTIWDIGGRDKMRPLLRHYYPGTDALIFVVDSGDRERLSYVTEELHNILHLDELEGVPIAIMANKQDLDNCMTVEEISKALRISDEQKRRDITAFATCAATGDGLSETLEWLDDQLAAKQAKHAVIKPLINAVPNSVVRFSGSVSEAVKDTFAYMMAWFSAPSSN